HRENYGWQHAGEFCILIKIKWFKIWIAHCYMAFFIVPLGADPPPVSLGIFRRGVDNLARQRDLCPSKVR
ncbi:MAG: hypothetical protein AAF488_16660, partial [Planctomycetota bacterium]